MFVLFGVKGTDLYNHDKGRAAVHEVINEEDIDYCLDDRIKYFQQLIVNKEISWANVVVFQITKDSFNAVKQWSNSNELMFRTQINPEAKTTKNKTMEEALEAMITSFSIPSAPPVTQATINPWADILEPEAGEDL